VCENIIELLRYLSTSWSNVATRNATRKSEVNQPSKSIVAKMALMRITHARMY